MEQKNTDAQNTDSENVVHSKRKLGIPIVALLFNIIPFLLFLMNPDVILLFLMSIFPIVGLLLGIISLCLGKRRIGKPGVILSIIAIAWPIVFIAVIFSFSATGSLTMNM